MDSFEQFPSDYVLPDYDGGSIANVPATIAELFGVPFTGMPALRPHFWQPAADNVDRVVLLIIDAFGSNILARNSDQLAFLTNRATIQGEITSVFPSTTVAAMSSLWTGLAPAQHGLMGLRLLLPELGTIGQMIHFTPAFAHAPGALVDGGLDPVKFIHGRGFAEQLADAGIPAYSFKGRAIVDSNLSKMHGRGIAAAYGAVTFADLLEQMATILERMAGEPAYLCGYWETIDLLSHLRAPLSLAVDLEINALFGQIERGFLNRLSAAARRRTLFIIVADHGQMFTPIEKQFYLSEHPDMYRELMMAPSGGPRAAYLFAQQGRTQEVAHYLEAEMKELALAMPAEEALDAHLFGPPPFAPQSRRRIGDFLLLPNAGRLVGSNPAYSQLPEFLGMHGGLHRDEMLVPWLLFRLDD